MPRAFGVMVITTAVLHSDCLGSNLVAIRIFLHMQLPNLCTEFALNHHNLDTIG